MSARSKIEKWILADWSTGNVPAVGEDVKIMSLQPNESTVADEVMVCKYTSSFVRRYTWFVRRYLLKCDRVRSIT